MRPRVLHLINSFSQGGTERQAVQLTRLLHADGRYSVHVACLDGGGVLRGELEVLGFRDIPEFPLTSFYSRNTFAQLHRFARLLAERNIQVVHTHDFYTNIFGMAAARWVRIPVRVASRRETEGLRGRAKKRLERGAFRFAHAIVTNAEAVRRHLIGEGVRAEKVVTIHNGVDMERLLPGTACRRSDLLRALQLPQVPPRRFVTIVANLRHTVKDHPTFLRAAARVKKEVPDAAFILAGEGELLESMRNFAAQLGLAQDVFFIGRCNQVADLLALSDVCVLSSSAEGFSNAILEYMAAARPVVATDAGGAREAVQDGATGYLVPVGDDEAMAARIVALLRAPEQARLMGTCGQQRVRHEFSCEAQLERTHNLYDGLLERTPSAARGPNNRAGIGCM